MALPSFYPHPLWFQWLADEVNEPYFKELVVKVQAEAKKGDVYPPAGDRYNALKMSPLDVRVVILGQDPYHGAGQAHGLAFSVRPGIKIPPSLRNIYQEIEAEGLAPAQGRDGCLQAWHDQGVLLLNNVLSVGAGQPGSHRGLGWERFTDAVVKELNEKRSGLVFLLWGRDAATKAAHVDTKKHLVLKSPHPSPYSASTGFLGNGHFRAANDWLKEGNLPPIRW